jgi:hypothetical protein
MATSSKMHISNVKVGGNITQVSLADGSVEMTMERVEFMTWGVKCILDQGSPGQGWYGKGKPERFTEGDARAKADELNAKNDGDRWEACELS